MSTKAPLMKIGFCSDGGKRWFGQGEIPVYETWIVAIR
jgi:hypothetical protein